MTGKNATLSGQSRLLASNPAKELEASRKAKGQRDARIKYRVQKKSRGKKIAAMAAVAFVGTVAILATDSPFDGDHWSEDAVDSIGDIFK